MRYTGPKVKKARRLGMAFTAKDAKILQKRSSAPGQHGQSRSRLSEYGIQLREKQKAKVMYGLTERQFENYFKKALGKKGVTGENLIYLLETRLDNFVYRAGFAESRAQARQIVSHGFVAVNQKKVDIPSYALKISDVVSIRPNKEKSTYISKVKEKIKSHKTQEWLVTDPTKLSSRLLTAPTSDLVSNPINTQLIVEHYSRT